MTHPALNPDPIRPAGTDDLGPSAFGLGIVIGMFVGLLLTLSAAGVR